MIFIKISPPAQGYRYHIFFKPKKEGKKSSIGTPSSYFLKKKIILSTIKVNGSELIPLLAYQSTLGAYQRSEMEKAWAPLKDLTEHWGKVAWNRLENNIPVLSLHKQLQPGPVVAPGKKEANSSIPFRDRSHRTVMAERYSHPRFTSTLGTVLPFYTQGTPRP